jgi:5-methyltetrahydrofolate--homocysteine methyltransferase
VQDNLGVKDSDIFIDPLVIAVSTSDNAALIFVETLRRIKKQFSQVKTISGLSNISFGLPLRKIVNRTFLTIALYEVWMQLLWNP